MASSIPSTMKAILVEEVGGPERLKYVTDRPVPQPKQDEILVHNKFAGVNFIDTYFRAGLYPSPTGYPLVIGQEASGTVAKLGEGENTYGFKEGDRVVWLRMGGYAEYTSLPAEKVVKIPDGIGDEDAVGGFLMGMTALSLVEEAYKVKKGDWVLIHAAAGGVGLLMCQILKAIGAKTIGTAGGPEKCKLAKENGADYLIDYKATSGPTWQEQVKKLTDGRGVDVVYDSVGKDTWEGSLDVVKRKGDVVFFGAASGPIPPFPVLRLSSKNTRVMRTTLMNYIYTREELEHYSNDLFTRLKAGELKIRIHKVYPLSEAEQAHRDLEGRKTTGKCLLSL